MKDNSIDKIWFYNKVLSEPQRIKIIKLICPKEGNYYGKKQNYRFNKG
jgi:hypothetical protein